MIFKLRLEVGLAKEWGVQKEAEGPGDEGQWGECCSKRKHMCKRPGEKEPRA